MTTIRRGALLIGRTGAVILGASVPAWAAFSDLVTVPTRITSATVAAPATVNVDDSCTTTTTVVKRTVYTHPSTGVQTQTAAGTLSTSRTVDADNLALQPRLSVSTLTSSGWTAQSGLTGYVSC